MTPEIFTLPTTPDFTEDQWSNAERDKDYYPILFELYKHVAIIGIQCVQIQRDSPGIRNIPPRHFAILIALLNRCCRLMLSNVRLTHDGSYGETMRLLNRCIIESSVNVTWLCRHDDSTLFQRYLGDGTKADVELLDHISSHVPDRNEKASVIATRMQRSIKRLIDSTGLSINEIKGTKKLPNFKMKLDSVGFDEYSYLLLQKLGSHAIHGTWPDLFKFYLEWDGAEKFSPSDVGCKPHQRDYVYVSILVLDAVKQFLTYIVQPKDSLDVRFPQIGETEKLLMKISDATP